MHQGDAVPSIRIPMSVVRYGYLVLLLAAVGVFSYSTWSLRDEKRDSEREYSRASADLAAVTRKLSSVEMRLHRLTTSVEAVERAGRDQFKMIRPGETLILVEEPAGAAPIEEPALPVLTTNGADSMAEEDPEP